MWCSVVKAIEGDGTMSVQLWPALKPDAKVNSAATEVTLHCAKLKEGKRNATSHVSPWIAASISSMILEYVEYHNPQSRHNHYDQHHVRLEQLAAREQKGCFDSFSQLQWHRGHYKEHQYQLGGEGNRQSDQDRDHRRPEIAAAWR